jgi:hypothetical protein
VALGSTRHFEISLATISPSRSKEDKISSSKLQESQLPPDVSGIADSVSVDLVELPAASDVAAWYDGVSGSMAARGVADMMSRISRDEDDEASLWRKKSRTAGEVFRAVAHRI